MTFQKNSLRAIMILAVFSVGSMGISQAFAQTTNFNAQTNIVGLCAVAVVNAGGFDYGDLSQGQVSGEINVNVDNTGTLEASVNTSGLDWFDGVPTKQMDGARTAYDTIGSSAWAGKTPITSTPAGVGSVDALSQKDLFYQVDVSLDVISFTGAISQSIDVIILCV